jgi:O-antigen/teichoic acid export membrane protein
MEFNNIKRNLSLTFLEQALVSLSNFLLPLIAIRLIDFNSYQNFVLILYYGLLVTTLFYNYGVTHNILFSPIRLKNPKDYQKKTNDVRIITIFTVLLISFLCLLVGLFFKYNLHLLIQFLIFFGARLYYETKRRIYLSEQNYFLIILNSVLIYVLPYILLFFMLPSNETEFLEVFNLCTIFLLLYLIKDIYNFAKNMKFFLDKAFFTLFIQSSIFSIANILTTRSQPIILFFVIGTYEASIFTLLMYLFSVAFPILNGITNYFLPKLHTVKYKTDNIYIVYMKVRNVLYLIISLGALISIIYSKEIISLIYDNRINDYSALLVGFMFLLLVVVSLNFKINFLRAKGKLEIVNKAYYYGLTVLIFLGIPLAYFFSIFGSFLSLALVYVLMNFYLGKKNYFYNTL